MLRLFLFSCCCLLLSCAAPELETSFYYWKAGFHLSDGEKNLLDKLETRTIYVKYFDLVLKDGNPVPEAVIRIDSHETGNFAMIPVVYITNETMKSIAGDEIGQLAQRIAKLVRDINRHAGQEPGEWQIDCDWSDQSRESYFTLLELLKKEIAPATLSATIRLHQVKYQKRTGVPPVDRGMLMHYNMGKLGEPEAPNSIYNHEDAENYLRYTDNYPLPLDLALPVFSWAVHFRDGAIKALNSKHLRAGYEKSPYFRKIAPDLYLADSSVIFRGDYFQKGDLAKMEEVSPALLLEAAQKIARHLPADDRKIAFFDLDSTILNSYSYENLSQVVDCFR